MEKTNLPSNIGEQVELLISLKIADYMADTVTTCVGDKVWRGLWYRLLDPKVDTLEAIRQTIQNETH